MDVLVVVDLQVGLLEGAPKHDLPGVVERINTLTETVRDSAGRVIRIRHCGQAGGAFEPQAAGWAFLPELACRPDDIVVEKALNDPFAGTALGETLAHLAPDRVLVTGWATDFCVDATVRSCVSNGHHVVAVADGHTVSHRPHLDARAVIEHHNWVWSGLITNRSVRVMATKDLLEALSGTDPQGQP